MFENEIPICIFDFFFFFEWKNYFSLFLMLKNIPTVGRSEKMDSWPIMQILKNNKIVFRIHFCSYFGLLPYRTSVCFMAQLMKTKKVKYNVMKEMFLVLIWQVTDYILSWTHLNGRRELDFSRIKDEDIFVGFIFQSVLSKIYFDSYLHVFLNRVIFSHK